MLMLLLERADVELDRDVIFLAEAGEEGTTRFGVDYMVENHWPEIEAEYFSDMKVWTTLLATGEHMQLVWAEFEPNGEYRLHSHPHEQISVMIKGRIKLTVGDEVREVGPGDM